MSSCIGREESLSILSLFRARVNLFYNTLFLHLLLTKTTGFFPLACAIDNGILPSLFDLLVTSSALESVSFFPPKKKRSSLAGLTTQFLLYTRNSVLTPLESITISQLFSFLSSSSHTQNASIDWRMQLTKKENSRKGWFHSPLRRDKNLVLHPLLRTSRQKSGC